jgi:DNA-binding SARP family transcriptional activator
MPFTALGGYVEFRILGPVEAQRDGHKVELAGSKVHTVLATLLLSRGKVVSDTQLSSMLWGWHPPATMSAQIYTYVSRLRKRLGPEITLIRQAPGYVLNVGDAKLDALEFEHLTQCGREYLAEREYQRAAQTFFTALALWRGPALANVTEYLTDVELPRLEEARVIAVEQRIEAELALGRHRHVLSELTGLVSRYPLREQLRAQLMTALYRCDRQADALTVYHSARSVLAEELGVDPGPVLNETYQAVLDNNLALPPQPQVVTASTAPTAAVPAPAPMMLPPDIPHFTGRTAELAELNWLMAHRNTQYEPHQPCRLLITGLAGMGKTALAVRAGYANAHHFPDGVLYVDTSQPDGTPCAPTDVIMRLLRALGEKTAGEAGDLHDLVRRYRTACHGKKLLVVLDNVAGEWQLDPLLPNSPGSVTLITSRAKAGSIACDQTTILRPLAEQEALYLLAAIAGKERALVDLESTDAIIRYCGGLPLALRTAGARLAARPFWTVSRLARRLADPHRRLDELSSGRLDVRATLLSTLDHVPDAAIALLPRLAPFGERWLTTDEAVAVTPGRPVHETEDLLDSLVDAHLLEARGSDDESDQLRYRFGPLVDLFAAKLTTAADQGIAG